VSFGHEGGVELVLENQNEVDYLSTELDKQKRKLREMMKLLEQQHQLTRLIIQVRIMFVFQRNF
jgi:hypothetical protein